MRSGQPSRTFVAKGTVCMQARIQGVRGVKGIGKSQKGSLILIQVLQDYAWLMRQKFTLVIGVRIRPYASYLPSHKLLT